MNKNILMLAMLILLREVPFMAAIGRKVNFEQEEQSLMVKNPPTTKRDVSLNTPDMVANGPQENFGQEDTPNWAANAPQANFGPEDHSQIVINPPKTTVRIDNGVDDLRDVYVHCKSGNNDLGFHIIPRSGSYQWSFKVNFWETTLFYCYLKYQLPNGGRIVRGGFDMYVAKRDRKRCPKFCVWSVLSDGIHGYREDSGLATSDLFFPWPNDNSFMKDGDQSPIHMTHQIKWRHNKK
ncbi:hypothetical protein FNV43_RR02261 [Rhamnella rubrinervis]|uniref:S-protein homolog n=1 Tax=Rhamnella rubrinervis TaxID=2594499 RepID=A0A8K0HTF7_9ROSA|nr:hypothetical protein FNV43_RR02261 [Rhamnella rubrinervis]